MTVPLGKVAYITRLSIIPNTKTSKTINIALYERDNSLVTSTPFGPRRLLWSADEISEIIENEFKSHIKIKPLTDLWFRAIAQAEAAVSVSLDYYLVDEDANGQ